jgi:threonine-phosphate decarboxylase
MQRLILLTKETNTYLIIDEAFYDFCSIPCTVVKEVEKHHHVIVLRSLTKMYRLAGIRIGYVVASQSIIQSISAYSPPWSVNRVAQEIALYVLSEPMYSKHIREKIDLERNRVTTELRNLGFTISNSAVNYYLLSTKTDLRESVDSLLPYLLKNGLVPRHTQNFKGLDGNYLRFAVKDYDCNNRLIQLIKGWSKP